MDTKREKLILGSRGNLALRLKERFSDAITIPRSEFLNWSTPDDILKVLQDRDVDIYVAVGIISKHATKQDLERVNLGIPKLVSEAIRDTNSRLITFGSIMEKSKKICEENPYINTKYRLSTYLEDKLPSEAFLHLRMHTLYGGAKPNTEMFLGQLFESIKNRANFSMTSGKQVREYHHIDDDIDAIEVLMTKGCRGVQEITHGEALKLFEIANKVLQHFKLGEMLRVGEITEIPSEIFSPIGVKSAELHEVNFRPSIEGIITYLSQCLNEQANKDRQFPNP